MIGRVIAHADDRARAIENLLAYLEHVQVTGISTNIPLLKRVLADGTFRSGVYDTDYLPNFLKRIDAKGLIDDMHEAAGVTGRSIDRDTINIEGSEELKVLSPSTSIFYIAPSPTEPEFVAVGDTIEVDKTLCQLEAMKIFTPLALKDFNNGEDELYPSSQQYKVTRINIESGQQVNVGDLLFVVKPQHKSAQAGSP
jgi:biotin carboxyl carrier protein